MNRRINIIAIAGFVAALIALMIYAANPTNVRRMQSRFLGLISPVLKSGSTIERKVTAFRKGLETLEELEREVQDLRVSNKELRATNQTLRGLEGENNRLRTALGYHERAVFKLNPAQIIARDASTWYSTVTIDRGSADGVAVDMPVLTEEGLVGKIVEVADHSSRVVLITDESCKVSASVEGTREQGIVKGERTASGSAMPTISLNFISKQANLQPGQKVLTSGVGGVFPAGIMIGTIREFKVTQLDGFAAVTPAVNLTTLQDVFVVVSAKR